MKRLIALLLIIICALLVAIYIFIPGTISIERAVLLNANQHGVFRTLHNERKWKLWWPGNEIFEADTQEVAAFEFKKTRYLLKQKIFEGFEVSIIQKKDTLKSLLTVLPLYVDSTGILWKVNVVPGNNPFRKLAAYRKAESITHQLDTILSRMKSFMEEKKNIYFMNIKEQKVSDTLLVSVKETFSHYPSTDEIYSLVDKIRSFINRKEAKEVNPPMLHVLEIENGKYEAMVAVPVNRILYNDGEFEFKRMVSGNILVGECKGGSFTARQAFNEMQNYVTDYQLSSPAIPFQSLVTERNKEPDTSKWVTKIYYPVF